MQYHHLQGFAGHRDNAALAVKAYVDVPTWSYEPTLLLICAVSSKKREPSQISQSHVTMCDMCQKTKIYCPYWNNIITRNTGTPPYSVPELCLFAKGWPSHISI